MIIVLKPSITDEETAHIMERIESLGLKPHLSKGEQTSIIGVIGDERKLMEQPIEAIAGVEKVMPVVKPYKMASREFKATKTVVDIGGARIGGDKVTIISGPCSVEDGDRTLKIAEGLKELGIELFRGGAYKPRTSPYSFQGLGVEGLKILANVRAETGMRVFTELVDVRDIEVMVEYTDVIQLGARNIQNYALLKEVGKVNKPVLLKRGFATTIQEFLMSAEYLLAHGNENVMLCERGIRTFETATRNTLDINAVPVLKELTHLPVVIDPSHATGKRNYVASMAYAAVAAGADGLIIESHFDPETAYSDGQQTVSLTQMKDMIETMKKVAAAVGRTM